MMIVMMMMMIIIIIIIIITKHKNNLLFTPPRIILATCHLAVELAQGQCRDTPVEMHKLHPCVRAAVGYVYSLV